MPETGVAGKTNGRTKRLQPLFESKAEFEIWQKKHEDLTTPKVLTMEYIHGIKISELEQLRAAGIDRKTIALGEFSFEVILTPGHAPGLVSLFERRTGLLFSADAVGEVVTWYTPSSGGLIAFLEGLERLSLLPARLLIPSHGGPSSCPREEIERTRRHLIKREERIVRELAAGPLSFPVLAGRVFRDPLTSFFPGPQIIQCHLDKLQAEGRVRLGGEEEGWPVDLCSNGG